MRSTFGICYLMETVPLKKTAKSGETKAAAEAVSQLALDTKSQADLFARAMKAFTAGDFKKAKPLFEEAGKGLVLSVAETARMYGRMCAQRMDKDKPEPKTAEERYNLAIGLMNSGEFGEAAQMLKAAVASAPKAGHIHYALGVSLGRTGDLAGAYAHVKKAFDLDPHNRVIARTDSDIAPLLQDAAIHGLVYQRLESPEMT